jgi:hypothetical protein
MSFNSIIPFLPIHPTTFCHNNCNNTPIAVKAAQDEEIASRDAEVWQIDDRKARIKTRKDAMFEEAQATRMHMIERAVEQLKLQTNSQHVLLNKQIADQRAKADQALSDKEAKAQLEWDETVISRTAQVARKAKDRADEKAIDDRLAAKWKKENEDGIQEVKNKAQRARDAQTGMCRCWCWCSW